MTYQTEEYKVYLKKLEDFKKIGWIKNHLQLMKKPNFWTILEYGESKGPNDRSAHETRYSKMLRWLIDANENHNLGNLFASKLMKLIGENYSFSPSKNKAIKATSEEKNIDVLYKDFSQNTYIVIELKQYAKEGKSNGYDSQLDKYETLVEEEIAKGNSSIQPYYIFLTPLKDKPSNPNWHAVSYQEIIDIMQQMIDESLTNASGLFIEDAKKVITDFKDDFQRTIDYLEKDHSYIRESLTEKEKALTLALAEEIQGEANTNYLNELLENEENKDEELEDLLLIIKDYTKAQMQNHSPNDAVRILIRKIYNALSAENQLDTNQLSEYATGETTAAISQSVINQYQLSFDQIELTRGKGQGLYLYHKDKKYRIYLSGDSKGRFPNHGIQLLTYDDKKIIMFSERIKNNQFSVDIDEILNNRISSKESGNIELEFLMENHIIPAIHELNNALNE